ncbi:MAG: efflux transporter outer membrane subunit [Sphingobium sp.]|nr:efflux transporter outer membrane subunit [Sphingobium sp.]
MSARSISALLLGAGLLAGCTVGPDYKAPAPKVAGQWVTPATPGAVQDAWWQGFNDPLLNALVDEMLAANPNLREAQARLAEARAARDTVRGQALPQVTANANATEMVLSKNGQIPIGSIPGFSREMGLFDLGFDASWEIDLWGRQVRAREAAKAREEQALYAAQGVRLQLVAELTRAYVDLRLAQREVALASEAQETRETLSRLTALRAQAGEANAIDSSQAASELESGRAALANAQANARAAALRVTALVGAQPETMLPRLDVTAPIPGPPAAIAAGLPSDLLRRRPDIGAAERDLAAATADVGVATADLFPRLRLGLSLGQQARAIGDLFSSDSTRLNAGPGLSWPVFNGGTTRARIRMADARLDQAAARYDAAVIGALSDSETAINRFDRALAAMSASEAAAQRDAAALALVQQRNARGEDDRLALSRARLANVAARQRSEEARAAASAAAIGLNKALGGGWKDAAE